MQKIPFKIALYSLPLVFFRHLSTFFVVILLAVTVFANSNRWDWTTLNGLQSFHNGPNCINAVLAAKGIVPHLSYIDSTEMKFFLENYCHENTNELHSEDILAVITENTIEHAAVYLNSQEIFEKLSSTGLYGKSSESNVGRFFRKTFRANSFYFTENQDERTIKTYSCLSAFKIQDDIKKICAARMISLIETIRNKFQKIALNASVQIDPTEFPLTEVQAFTGQLAKVPPEDKCFPYLFAVGASTFGSFFHLSSEIAGNTSLQNASDSLYEELRMLKRKYLSSQQHPKIQSILQEFTWGGKE